MQLEPGTNGIMLEIIACTPQRTFCVGLSEPSSYLFQGIRRKLANFIFHGAYSKDLLVADIGVTAKVIARITGH
jgi:hypothetical protein